MGKWYLGTPRIDFCDPCRPHIMEKGAAGPNSQVLITCKTFESQLKREQASLEQHKPSVAEGQVLTSGKSPENQLPGVCPEKPSRIWLGRIQWIIPTHGRSVADLMTKHTFRSHLGRDWCGRLAALVGLSSIRRSRQPKTCSGTEMQVWKVICSLGGLRR